MYVQINSYSTYITTYTSYIHVKKNRNDQAGGEQTPTRTCDVCRGLERGRYPKLSLRNLETSEDVRSGMGSIGWKEGWYIWEEWWATLPPTELGKHEEEEDKEEMDWGFGLELQMMEGWDTAEERGVRGTKSSCPNDWLRDCLKVDLDLDGYEVPSPCCPANRQLSTNLWEPMASWGSMWRWRRDIILGAVGTKEQHYQQPLIKRNSDGQGEKCGKWAERYSDAGMHFFPLTSSDIQTLKMYYES